MSFDMSKARQAAPGFNKETGKSKHAEANDTEKGEPQRFTLALERSPHSTFNAWLVSRRLATGLSSKRLNMASVIRALVDEFLADEELQKRVTERAARDTKKGAP